MKKVLVTGASGFIGRHSLEPLSRRGYDIHAISSRDPLRGYDNVHWHRADLLRAGDRTRIIAQVRPSHLLHLAWFATPGKFWTAPENQDWIAATLHLVQEFRRMGGRRVVAAGSCAEYEWGGDEPLTEEVTPLRPATIYGAAKHAARLALDAVAAQTNLSTAWGRVFFVYGPHESRERLVPSVILSLLRGEIARCTHGQQVRDFLHVADVAEAFAALLESDLKGPVNIASGHAIQLSEVIETIGEKLGRPDLIKLGAIDPPRPEPATIVANTRILNDELRWRPRYDLNSGLEQTIEWWRKNRTNGC